MTIAPSEEPAATFGSGGTEPYARALRAAGRPMLYLRTDDGGEIGAAGMDVSRWNAEADAADRSLLQSVSGPVLDIGCGPGRMVRAAMDLGMPAMGIDVSPTAVEIATDAGLNVMHGSVFEALPSEGHWQTVLLIDGNVGIGGDVTAMLARCRQLLTPDGEIVVELHPDPTIDSTFSGLVVDTHGNQSASFPWAEIGLDGIARRGGELGLTVRQSWSLDSRSFCRLVDSSR